MANGGDTSPTSPQPKKHLEVLGEIKQRYRKHLAKLQVSKEKFPLGQETWPWHAWGRQVELRYSPRHFLWSSHLGCSPNISRALSRQGMFERTDTPAAWLPD